MEDSTNEAERWIVVRIHIRLILSSLLFHQLPVLRKSISLRT
jgi:hypothetical protein